MIGGDAGNAVIGAAPFFRRVVAQEVGTSPCGQDELGVAGIEQRANPEIAKRIVCCKRAAEEIDFWCAAIKHHGRSTLFTALEMAVMEKLVSICCSF